MYLANKEFKNMNKSTIIIGIGTAGCKIVSKLDNTYKHAFIDGKEEVIEKYSGLRIGNDPNPFWEQAEMDTFKQRQDVLNVIQNFDNIILVCPLGGNCGCGITKKVVEIASFAGKNVTLVTSCPFEFEGAKRAEMRLRTSVYLKDLCKLIFVKNYNSTDSGQKTMIIKDIFDKQDELFIEKINEILSE